MLRNIVNFLEKEKTKKIKFTREYTVPERDADRIKRKADAEIEKVIKGIVDDNVVETPSRPDDSRMLFGDGVTGGRLRKYPEVQNTLQEFIYNHPRFAAKDFGWREKIAVDVQARLRELIPNSDELSLTTARAWVDKVHAHILGLTPEEFRDQKSKRPKNLETHSKKAPYSESCPVDTCAYKTKPTTKPGALSSMWAHCRNVHYRDYGLPTGNGKPEGDEPLVRGVDYIPYYDFKGMLERGDISYKQATAVHLDNGGDLRNLNVATGRPYVRENFVTDKFYKTKRVDKFDYTEMYRRHLQNQPVTIVAETPQARPVTKSWVRENKTMKYGTKLSFSMIKIPTESSLFVPSTEVPTGKVGKRDQKWWSPKKAAKYLNVDPSTITKYCHLGTIRSIKLGALWYVDRIWLKEHFEEATSRRNRNLRVINE